MGVVHWKLGGLCVVGGRSGRLYQLGYCRYHLLQHEVRIRLVISYLKMWMSYCAYRRKMGDVSSYICYLFIYRLVVIISVTFLSTGLL